MLALTIKVAFQISSTTIGSAGGTTVAFDFAGLSMLLGVYTFKSDNTF